MKLDGIVLDLDDTLLDTTGLLLPPADARAVHLLRERGLDLELDPARALIDDLRAEGVVDPFRELAARHGLAPAAGDAAHEAFLRFAETVSELALDPAVARTLDTLGALAPLAILTGGNPLTQQRKVELLGIAPRFAECVYVGTCDSGGKTGALRDLIERHGWRAPHVLIAGDRPDSDIRAGNENGCLTVLVRRPGTEFAACPTDDPRDRPWREIGNVGELPALLDAPEPPR